MQKNTSNIRTLNDTPYYFGHYLNMARHNLYLILSHIEEKFELYEKDLNEDALQDSKVIKLWGNKKKLDQSQKMAKALQKHFRWIETLSEQFEIKSQNAKKHNPTPVEIFTDAILRLNKLRNYYTHFDSEKDETLPAFDIQLLFNTSKDKILVRHKDVIKDTADIIHLEDYILYESDNQWYSEKGLIFFICLFLDDKNANTFMRKVPGFKRSESISEKATVACYTNFCTKLPEPKLESGDVLLDMLNELDRCPKELFHLLSEDDKKKFYDDVFEKDDNGNDVLVGKMDMTRSNDRFPYFAMRYFDETNAFPTLRFQLDLGRLQKDYYLKNILGEDQDRYIFEPLHTFGRLQNFNASTLPTTWCKSDKLLDNSTVKQFSPHYNMDENVIAMKFVTDEPNWNNIRQAVSVYQNNKRVRETEQGERKTFQLNPIPDVVMSKEEFQNLFLYHYLCKQGLITIDVETFIKSHQKKFRDCCEDIKSGKIASIQLPVSVGNKSDFEKAQIEKEALITHLKGFGHDIDPMDLPKDLRHFLGKKHTKPYRERLLNTVQMQLDEAMAIRGKCKQAIADYEVEKNKELRKKLPFRIGDAAIFVAADMIHLKPLNDENGGKPNNLQFSFLQAKIAEFSSHRDTVKAYFKELGLIQNEKNGYDFTHPFLYQIKIDECIGGFDFCLAYTKKKIKWLEEIVWNIKGGTKKNNQTRVEKKYEKLPEDVLKERYEVYFSKEKKSALEKEYGNVVTYLPRGFFNDAIRAALMQVTDYQVTMKDNTVTCLRKMIKNDTQRFYVEYERHYKKTIVDKEEITSGFTKNNDFLNEVKKIKKEAQFSKTDLESAKKELKNQREKWSEKAKDLKDEIIFFEREMNAWNSYAHYIMDNEKRIRFVQSNDRALWLMATDLAKEREKYNSAESANTIQIDFEDQFLSKIGFDQKDNNLMTEPRMMEVNIHGKKIEAILWLRLYGKFRRFLKDRRLKEMLHFFQADSVLLKRLQSEMDYFDLHREEVFERTYSFEQKIRTVYKDDFEIFIAAEKAAGKVKGSHIPHFQYLKFLQENKNIWLPATLDVGDASEFVNYRNKLEHNELYYTDAFKRVLNFDENRQRKIDDDLLATDNNAVLQPILANQILNQMASMYDYLINNIQ